MSSRTLIASAFSIAAIVTVGMATPTFADDPANLDQFHTTCLTADAMLLGDVQEGFDTQAVMTPLCSCLVTQFSGFSQPEVDMLTTDLDGSSTDETHSAYPDYPALSAKAGDGLQACFESDEVSTVMKAQPGGDSM